MKTFYELGLSSQVLRALDSMGFEEMTPIQEKALPLGLVGKDMVGQAQTGTGKTAAFGIPMIEKVEKEARYPQGLVVTPTRELAIQVAEELNRIGQFKGAYTIPVYGGQEISRQIRALKKRPQIVVGTPGRLLDHIRRKTIRLQDIRVVVLDEADEMLKMGFIEDVEAILTEVPENRQTLLFSATMPSQIQQLAKKFLKDPEILKVQAKEMTVPGIEQRYVEVKEKQKFDALCLLLDSQSPDQAMVFGRTKRRVDELTEGLNKRGYAAEGIHGDLPQSKRETVLRNFRKGMIDILVATDVAARGLDISGVTHVYNFDIPQDAESYVHRIGRTGRLGRTGLAVTFVTARELDHLRSVERITKSKMLKMAIPSPADALEGQQKLTIEKLLEGAREDTGAYKHLAIELLEEYDSVNLLAAALKMLTKEPDKTPVELTAEKPVGGRMKRPSKKPRGGGRRGGRKGVTVN